MTQSARFTVRVALIVALGGFLMGFDASVISGVVGFIETEFSLTKLQLGWSVASLTLTATLAMMVAGPLSDRLGRRPVLLLAAALFTVSALASAVAPNFLFLVVARMIGGLGVGAALIIAPMYIAEIAPAEQRGRLVSFNQLNIVIGISVAFFSNYLILQLGQSDLPWAQVLRLGDWNWRWMLGAETLPAVVYFFALTAVPESPRWLAMHGRDADALRVFGRVSGPGQASANLAIVHDSLAACAAEQAASLKELFQPAMKLVLTHRHFNRDLAANHGHQLGVFLCADDFRAVGHRDRRRLYAGGAGRCREPGLHRRCHCIDRQAGSQTAAHRRAGGHRRLHAEPVLRFRRRKLFAQSDCDRRASSADRPRAHRAGDRRDLRQRRRVPGRRIDAIGADAFAQHESALVSAAIDVDPLLILLGILGFVASFAVSLGPVMWVLFSELFPNRLRGLAISLAGLVNSAVSFTVQLVFPWELANLGNALTFLIYALFAVAGLLIVLRIVPETKGRSLEELENLLVGH
jgi:SP family arabinose:H+ symporter-like MFS transporter